MMDKRKNQIKQSVCSISKKCGGCQYLGVPYEQQLKKKQKEMEQLFSKYHKVLPIIGTKMPEHYRCKVHAVFGRDRKGNVLCGTYQEGTHRILQTEHCLIEDEKSQEIIRTVCELAKSFKLKIYDEDTRFGLLRHVMVRKGYFTGEYMVILVLASPILPSKNNFVKALRAKHPEITTVVLNVNEKKTNMVLGTRDIVLYGKGYIYDTLCGCRFRISPQSFYQINPPQTQILYEKAMEFAQLKGKERVIDAYCGTGTIGLVAAKQAKEVIGIELNKDAVEDARKNAKENKAGNIRFYQGDAGVFMVAMAEEEAEVDVVFMDPPRAGSDEKFLNSVIKLQPKRVVYVSCNPETLDRDLNYLVKKGYGVRKIQPVDLFPYTEHCETVVLLSK